MRTFGIGPREAWSLGFVESLMMLEARARLSAEIAPLLFSRRPQNSKGEEDGHDPLDGKTRLRPDGTTETYIGSVDSLRQFLGGKI